MNNELVNSIRKSVKKELTKDRYQHTLGVAYTAASMAMCFQADVEKAFIAGLLHDCAKCIPDEDKIRECQKHGLAITSAEKKSPYLLHSKLGAFYVSSKYHIEDLDIINAVFYHTTGRAEMSLLEKIIFTADYIEPHRDKAPNLEYIRELAFKDIDKAVLKIAEDTLKYLKAENRTIDKATQLTYEYYSNIK